MFRTGARLGGYVVMATWCVGIAGWPGLASAEPSAQDVASAKANLAEGRSLAKANDQEGARRHFLAAWSLVPTPITGIEAARAEATAGHLVEAREICLSIAKIPVAPTEKAEHRTARSDAATLADTLRSRIPSIVLGVEGAPTDASVTLDGKPVKNELLGATLVVNPGHHRAVVSVEGATKTVEFDISEGERKSIVLPTPDRGSAGPATGTSRAQPPPPPADPAQGKPQVTAPTSVTPPGPATEHGSSALRILPWVVGGVGVATLAAAGGLALAARSRWNQSNENNLCVDDGCVEEGLKIRSDARSLGDVATVLTGIGAAALVTSAVLFVVRPSSSDHGAASLSVGLGPQWLGVTGRF